jgi:uncharacterized DUF497 family protein
MRPTKGDEMEEEVYWLFDDNDFQPTFVERWQEAGVLIGVAIAAAVITMTAEYGVSKISEWKASRKTRKAYEAMKLEVVA